MNRSADTIEISDLKALPDKPLVSVYMLAYNHEKFIADAIEGVIAQQCTFPIELIIGEDCSPDGTLAIATNYQRRYPSLIRILTSSKNIGGLANADRCLMASRGTYIAICEGDDYWHHPEKLQMQVQCFNNHPDAHLVHTDYDRRIGQRVLRNANKRNPPAYLAQGDAYRALLRCVSVVNATTLYRKQLLTSLRDSGIASPHWPFGDYPRTLYAAVQGPVIYIPVSTATYRHVQGSATNSGRLQSLQMELAVMECREKFMSIYKLPETLERGLQIDFHKSLRRNSTLAANKDTYIDMCQWLTSNGSPPSYLSHLIASALIQCKPLLRIYRTTLKVATELRYRLQYERIDR